MSRWGPPVPPSDRPPRDWDAYGGKARDERGAPLPPLIPLPPSIGRGYGGERGMGGPTPRPGGADSAGFGGGYYS